MCGCVVTLVTIFLLLLLESTTEPKPSREETITRPRRADNASRNDATMLVMIVNVMLELDIRRDATDPTAELGSPSDSFEYCTFLSRVFKMILVFPFANQKLALSRQRFGRPPSSWHEIPILRHPRATKFYHSHK